jgi:hypothetical protein
VIVHNLDGFSGADSGKGRIIKGVKGFISSKPEATNVGAESRMDLFQARFPHQFIPSGTIHMELRHLTPVFGKIAFEGISPPNIMLGRQCSWN